MDGKEDHRPDTYPDAQDNAGVEELPFVQEAIAQAHGQQVIPERKQGRAAQAERNGFVVAIGSEAIPKAHRHNMPVEMVLVQGHRPGQRHRKAHRKLDQKQFRLWILVHEGFE